MQSRVFAASVGKLANVEASKPKSSHQKVPKRGAEKQPRISCLGPYSNCFEFPASALKALLFFVGSSWSQEMPGLRHWIVAGREAAGAVPGEPWRLGGSRGIGLYTYGLHGWLITGGC